MVTSKPVCRTTVPNGESGPFILPQATRTAGLAGEGFTVKQGATSIHESVAICKIYGVHLDNGRGNIYTTFQMDVSRRDSQTTHIVILTDTENEKWNGKSRRACDNGSI